MILTGKCLQDFSIWYLHKEEYSNYQIIEPYQEEVNIGLYFYEMPKSMQYGVYVDFFDSVGFELLVERSVDDDLNFINAFDWVVLNIENGNNYGGGEISDTREDARHEAVKLANEIYNFAQ
jgi:hypothetical protein